MTVLASSGTVLASGAGTLASGYQFDVVPPGVVERQVYLVEFDDESGEPVRLASEDFLSRPDDTPASTLYRGDLAADTAMRYRRSLSFWVWGRPTDPTRGRSSGGGRSGSGELSINNRDGFYDRLIDQDLRDQELVVRSVTVRRLGDQDLISGGQVLARTHVDTLKAPDDSRLRVALVDPLSQLDKPIQRATFGDEADEGHQGRLLPMLIGLARNIPPPLWDAPDLQYRISDGPLAAVGVVRDKGNALDPTGPPAQWSFDAEIDNAGVVLVSDPVGVVTVDASTQGEAQLPPTPVDALDGDGVFDEAFVGGTVDYYGKDFDGSDNLDRSEVSLPPGWENYNTGNVGGGTVGAYRVQWLEPGLRMSNVANSQAAYSYIHSTAVLESGKSYRWTVTLLSKIRGGNPALGQYARLRLRLFPRRQDLLLARDSRDPAGTFSGTITLPTTVANQQVEIFVENTGALVELDDLTLFELSETPVLALEGITLEDYAREVVLDRAGLPASAMDLASFAAIDDDAKDGNGDTPEIGVWFKNPASTLATLRAPLDSYSADVFTRRDGTLVAARLYDPSLRAGNAQAGIWVQPQIGTDPAFVTIGSREYIIPGESGVSPSEAVTMYASVTSEANVISTDHNSKNEFLGVMLNLWKAINGTGIPGVDYGLGTAPHESVAMTDPYTFGPSAIRALLTARQPGASGNSIGVSFSEAGGIARYRFYFRNVENTAGVSNLEGGGDIDPFRITPANLEDTPAPYVDTAPGLTTTAIARLNWHVFRGGDFADVVPLDTREQFKERGQFIETAPDDAQLPATYRHAVQADPLPTVFDSPEAALREISRVVDIYRTVRRFWDVQVWLDPGEALDLDDVVTVEHPRYGLDLPRALLVAGVDDAIEGPARRRVVRLLLWG